jgi:multicomponent Na+:H+ antiporter subunit G
MMDLIITIISGILISIGTFLIVVAAIGVVRFPDCYSRMHPAGKGDTLGQGLVLAGLMVYEGFDLISIKLLIIIIFIFIANPTATHALAKAAYIAGVKPWIKEESESK